MADAKVLNKDELFLLSVGANVLLALMLANLYEQRKELLNKKVK